MQTLHLAAACIALLLSVIVWVRLVFQLNVNATAFHSVLRRLIDASDIKRAVKLCQASGRMVLPVAIEPILHVALSEPPDLLPALAAVTRVQLQAAEDLLTRWRDALAVTAVVALISAGAGVLAPGDALPYGWVLLAGAALMLLWAASQLIRIRADIRSMPVELLRPLMGHLTGEAPSAQAVVEAVLAAGSSAEPVTPEP
jgi:hypothetical protein